MPTLWYVPTRSVPAAPAESAARSACAACEPGDDRLGVAQEQPPGLGQRDRARAAGALDEPLADERSSVAICWLTADCV